MPKYLLCLLIWTVALWGGINEKPGTAAGEARDIEAVVRAAVEDESWWKAKDPQQLRAALSRYYAEPLLSEVCGKVWSFLSAPTDWYTHTYVMVTVVQVIKNGEAEAVATLQNKDVITGEVKKGRGIFLLRQTATGWKIIKADFFWEGEEVP